jgi:phosphoserine phosphatase
LSSLRLPDGSVPELYFVDMDGTLLSISSEKCFLIDLLRSRVLGAAGVIRFFCGYLLHPILTAREGKGWNRTYLRSVDPEVAGRKAAECAGNLLKDHLRSWTAGSIRELLEAGCAPVLMSASLHMIAEGIARGLGVSDVCASRPEISSGRFTGRLTGPRPWGRSKVDLARAYCRDRGTELEKCAAAGDSWADRFILKECGCPVAVCPDVRLGGMARERGWTVVDGKHARWA